MLGTCRLCQRKAELQKSHYLPKAAYKAVSRSDRPTDGAPIKLDFRNNAAVQTSAQVATPLLCADCEALFSREGEDYVMRRIYRRPGEFRLRDALSTVTPRETPTGNQFYFCEDLLGAVAAEPFAYFGLSVIWRGSSADWPDEAGEIRNCLGPKYDSAVRDFLLSGGPVPKNVRVDVRVEFDNPDLVGLSFPQFVGRVPVSKTSKARMFAFLIPGVRFDVLIGGGLDGSRHLAELGTRHPVIFYRYRYVESDVFRHVLPKAKKLEPKGKLSLD